jgi:hypothetical protein
VFAKRVGLADTTFEDEVTNPPVRNGELLAHACPRCHRVYEAFFVLGGFTRRTLPIIELIEPPLTKRTRYALLGTWAVRRHVAAGQD